MASAWSKIATYTPSGSPSTFTFSAIPGTYNWLVIRAFAGADSGTSGPQPFTIRFNGDTANNYSYVGYFANGGTASKELLTGTSAIKTGGTLANNGNPFTNAEIYVAKYTSTSLQKSVLAYGAGGTTGSGANATYGFYYGLWASTSAITSITLITGATISSNSRFTLYGIA